jgi:hypothetical protein
MWKVYFCNFGYYSANEGGSFEEAVKIAQRAGFQAQIYDPSGSVFATWCPMAGVQRLDRSYYTAA